MEVGAFHKDKVVMYKFISIMGIMHHQMEQIHGHINQSEARLRKQRCLARDDKMYVPLTPHPDSRQMPARENEDMSHAAL